PMRLLNLCRGMGIVTILGHFHVPLRLLGKKFLILRFSECAYVSRFKPLNCQNQSFSLITDGKNRK
ncbi:hypothetical protein, partial [uncultured Duncaniella sp.]|uniref:hypothetical protein n=1 Tax=uncultured Duncaniella sp. TaxID=2768039 RepID=UPI0026198B06